MIETIKASVLLTVKNKNDVLANTLTSLAQQRTNFDFEICILNDEPDNDIEAVVRQYLIEKQNFSSHLKRVAYAVVPRSLGFNFAPAACMQMMSPSSSIVVISSADCLMLDDDLVQSLCERARSKRIVLAEVVNTKVDPNFYKNFENERQSYFNQWKSFLEQEKIQTGRVWPHIWLLFVGAMMKQDMLELEYDKNCCDAIIWQKIKNQKPLVYSAEVVTYARALHQQHLHVPYPCDVEKQCTYHCSRTWKSRKIASPMSLYQVLGDVVYEGENNSTIILPCMNKHLQEYARKAKKLVGNRCSLSELS